MSQVSSSVFTRSSGSTRAEAASGRRIMSDSLMCWKPRMLLPSKPTPSTNMLSSSSVTGELKCCDVPSRSVKRKSTIFTSCARQNSMTDDGLAILRSEIWLRICSFIDPASPDGVALKTKAAPRNGGAVAQTVYTLVQLSAQIYQTEARSVKRNPALNRSRDPHGRWLTGGTVFNRLTVTGRRGGPHALHVFNHP